MPPGASLERFGEKDFVFIKLQNADTSPLLNITWDLRKFSMVFFIVFLANIGKKLQEKIREMIMGPVNLTLNIPLAF